MKKIVFVVAGLGVLAGLWALGSCSDREPAPICPVPIEFNRTQRFMTGFKGVDLLVVVDDSNSMAEEQAILATQFFTLVNSLVFPTEDWQFPPAQSVRIAVVSSDMGVQFGKGEVSDVSLSNCHGKGNNGLFRTYQEKQINLQEGEIKCDLNGVDQWAKQCPTDWICEDDDGNGAIGHCYDPDGDGSLQACPGLNATYAQTPLGEGEEPNFELAFQAACLGSLGTEGCGFEQQLMAAAKGLVHPDNNPDKDNTFYRAEYLLAVLVVSDEEDCSIKDGELFHTEEMDTGVKPHMLNIACGRNEEMLYPTEWFKNHFHKFKGDERSTIFAAIVGVPWSDEESPPHRCEGSGLDIGDCLDHPDMALEEVVETDDGQEYYAYREACRREEGEELVTMARPGRRYIDLAQQFGDYSYVSSICRKDWSPAMSQIASLIARKLQGTCYPKPLDWDPDEKKAKCNVVVRYEGFEECPFELEEGATPIKAEDVVGETAVDYLLCPLPRLEAALDCQKVKDNPKLSDDETVGWYYCEDNRENFELACDPAGPWGGVDDDQDGKIDCEDKECWKCEACRDVDGVVPAEAEDDCLPSCKFKVELTEKARQISRGHRIDVHCLQQFTFADVNCQENTQDVCNDGIDNDGSGVADCDDREDKGYLADRNCCPMSVDKKGNCVIDDDRIKDICPKNKKQSKACLSNARALKCNLDYSFENNG